MCLKDWSVMLCLSASAVSAALCACNSANASISLTSLNTATPTQDFESLAPPESGSPVPTGWAFLETGTNLDGLYTVGTGSSNAGDTYSFGLADADRAFGMLRSGALVSRIGAEYTNNTGSVITQLDIAYRGEQWRLGAVSRSDRLDFEYSTVATDSNSGATTSAGLSDTFTWLAGPISLDFVAPLTTGAIGAKDGNATGNFANVSGSVLGLSIPIGATFWIRWTDFDATGADDGLAIDNFALTPRGDAVAAVPEVSTFLVWSILCGCVFAGRKAFGKLTLNPATLHSYPT